MDLTTVLKELPTPSPWLMLVVGTVATVLFAKTCLSIGMLVLEYLIITSLMVVLLPFMMFEKLRFVGDKVVGTIINTNEIICCAISYVLF